jgi:gentisate 1,2-dioxygenase
VQDYVNKLTGGKPSEIIERCDHTLDLGLERKVPRLTAKFAKEVFKERGFTY